MCRVYVRLEPSVDVNAGSCVHASDSRGLAGRRARSLSVAVPLFSLSRLRLKCESVRERLLSAAIFNSTTFYVSSEKILFHSTKTIC